MREVTLSHGALLLSVSALVACSQGGKSSSSGEKFLAMFTLLIRYIRLFFLCPISNQLQNLQEMLKMAY